jgi:hypothetical protein
LISSSCHKGVIITLCLIFSSLIFFSCSSQDVQEDKQKPIKAIYLAPKSGAQLSGDELRKYQEITVVNNFKDFKSRMGEKVAIWIDKGAIELVD